MTTRKEMRDVMRTVFDECKEFFNAGQQEYAARESSSFANFERVAERTGVSRELALLVFLEKHMDGIHSYIKGHRSQREDVEGRINDAIVYLCLLRGMVEENREIEDHQATLFDVNGIDLPFLGADAAVAVHQPDVIPRPKFSSEM